MHRLAILFLAAGLLLAQEPAPKSELDWKTLFEKANDAGTKWKARAEQLELRVKQLEATLAAQEERLFRAEMNSAQEAREPASSESNQAGRLNELAEASRLSDAAIAYLNANDYFNAGQSWNKAMQIIVRTTPKLKPQADAVAAQFAALAAAPKSDQREYTKRLLQAMDSFNAAQAALR
jgi:hypothetical protein